MIRFNRRFFYNSMAIALAAGSVLLPQTAWAQDTWPNKAITIIVPFSPAGSNDVIARTIAAEMSKSLQQPVVVENRPGAGGLLGAGLLTKAPADGYTLMLASSSMTAGLALKRGLAFDRKAFTPIAMPARGPLILVASNKLAANTPAELVALAKANPKQLSYGSSGIGSVTHMGMELLQLTGNVEMLHVPYKGGSLAVNDIVGGQVDLYLSSFPSASQLMRAGKLKAIGVTTAERSPVAPDVPPLADALPGFSIELWWGIFGPKGMPDKLVAQINAEVRKAAESPAMKKFAESEGAVITNLNPDQFGKIYDHEIDSWQMVGEKTHVQIE